MRQTLFHTTEGRLVMLGLGLVAGWIGLAGYFLVVEPAVSKTMFLVVLAHFMGSRAGGIGLCILHGFSPLATVAYNFYVETLIVCFTYAGFVLSTTNYLKVEWVKRFMDQLAGKAMEKKDKIRKWGWIGIFSFVMAPLPVTGPVIGSIIGYMLRMNLFSNFTATALGTLAATVVWCYGFDYLQQFQVVQYVFAAIVAIVLIPYIKPIKRFLAECLRKKPPVR